MTEVVYDAMLAMLVVTAWLLWWALHKRETNNTAAMQHWKNGHWSSCGDPECKACK